MVFFKRLGLASVEDPRRTQSEINIHTSNRALQSHVNRDLDPNETAEFYTAIGADGIELFILQNSKYILTTKILLMCI